MSTQDDTPILLATEEQLIDELARRNSAVVVARTRKGKTGECDTDVILDYRGGLLAGVGLLAHSMARMNYHIARNSSIIDKDSP